MFSYEAADAVDTAFAEFGTPANYTSPGVGAVSFCRIVAKSGDRMVSFGEGRPFAEGVTIDVRASEIGCPAEHGTFTPGTFSPRGTWSDGVYTPGSFAPGAVSYTIIGDPETRDDLRLVWTCRVEAQS